MNELIISLLFAVSMIESNNGENLIGDNGRALGHLQIHKEVVIDVNTHYGTNYCHSDMMQREAAEDVFLKYLSLGCRLYFDKYGSRPKKADVLMMWNVGIYSGAWNEEYYRKYINLKCEKKT